MLISNTVGIHSLNTGKKNTACYTINFDLNYRVNFDPKIMEYR
jgi:hypothetical protein